MSWRELAPGPGSFWVRWSPRRAPAPLTARLDLAARRLAWPAEGERPGPARPALAPPPRADLVYLPAGPKWAESLAAELAATGSAALVPLLPGEEVELPDSATRVWDLLPLLLSGVASALDGLAAARHPGGRLWIALPLLPALWRDDSEVEAVLDAAGRCAADAIVPVAPELKPTDRRRLAESLGEERFEAVFHGPTVSERTVVAALRARGLAWRLPRPPLPGGSPRRARNRELAAALAEAAELWLRLGRAEPEGLAMAAAARHLDGTTLDVASIARERNLEVIEWLSPRARSIVAELAAAGHATLLEELVVAWSSPTPEAS